MHPLFKNYNYAGIAVEGDSDVKKKLEKVVNSYTGDVKLSWGFVSPDTVCAELRRHGAPAEGQ